MIIGACIIKHKFNLSDEETIEMIRENPYIQYFCGLTEFTDTPIFDLVCLLQFVSALVLKKSTI